MKYAPKYAIQTAGDMRHWSNPERTFKLAMIKFNFDCEPDVYPGILIVTDPEYRKVNVIEVFVPRRELPQIFASLPDNTIAFWRISGKEEERKEILAKLTSTPIFDDIN